MKYDEQTLIGLILGFIPQDYNYKSNLYSAWQTASENVRYRPFVSLLLYLIGLEQIGDLFFDDIAKKDNNGIIKVFRKFYSNLEPRQLQGIKHLRHSLAHDYGLMCVDTEENKRCEKENKKREKQGLLLQPLTGFYHYTLDFTTENNPFIIVSSEADTHFDVYVRSFIKQVFNIRKIMSDLYFNDELHFVTKSGEKKNLTNDELLNIHEKYFSPSYAMDETQFNNVPKLYHYTSFENALKILTTNKLKFSSLRNIYDFNGLEKTVTRYITADSTPEDSKVAIAELEKELLKYKQISLSIDNNTANGFAIPSLWKHYAQNGYGVCLVFDKMLLTKSLSKKCDCCSVKYVKHSDNTIIYDGTNLQSYIKKNKRKLFFTKSNDWSYEQEFRIISSSEDAIDIGESLIAVITCLEDTDNKGLSINREILNRIIPGNVLLLHYNHLENRLCSEDGDAWSMTDMDKWQICLDDKLK